MTILEGENQFGCGILNMVGPKKQDWWPKVDVLKENHFILRIRGSNSSSNNGHNFRK